MLSVLFLSLFLFLSLSHTHSLSLPLSVSSLFQIPVVVDSSKFDVCIAGLECLQGKCLFNSISLKVGEEVTATQLPLYVVMLASIVVLRCA